MTAIKGAHAPLGRLRAKIVSLASSRFEKFYHHSTGTHIIKQLEGTEFRAPGIRGVGDFADEAYSSYVTALERYVADQDECRLRDLEVQLSNFAAVGARKVELQVQIPDLLAEEMKNRAKEKNLSLGSYVNTLLDYWLPFDFDDAQIDTWAEKFVPKIDIARDNVIRHHLFTLPLTAQEFERLEWIQERISMTQRVTLNDIVLNVIAANKSAASISSPSQRLQ